MPEDALAAGVSCLALLGGEWVAATIRHAAEDGTFTLEPDERRSIVMPRWYGVTRLEIAIDDESAWRDLFPRVAGPDGRIGWAEMHRAFAAGGIVVDEAPMRDFWARQCQERFGLDLDGRLDEAQAYAVVRGAGTVARRLATGVPPGNRWFRMYWNQVRMGGRDPDDLARPITLDDALGALGLGGAPADPEAVQAVAAFEAKHGLRLPSTLAHVATRQGVSEAIHASHCNSPEWMPVSEWEASRGRRSDKVDGDVVINVIAPHQGDHHWAVAFDDGDADARVCLTWPGADDVEQALPMAPTLPLFLWDLAQVGAAWYLEVSHDLAAGLRRSDVGWVREGVP